MEKEYRKYSEDLKKRVVAEVESGAISQAEACRRYGLRRGAVWDWLKIYGRINRRRVVEVVMSDQKDKIEELKQALADAHLKLRLYDKLMELAQDEYQIDLKKNYSTKALELLNKTEKKSKSSAE